MARNTRITGDAGAFLVGAELAIRGWPSALTSAGTARTDLLAQVGERRLPAAIQVKTKGERSKDFQPGGVSSPAAAGANEWVVLVALGPSARHTFFVLPRNVMFAAVKAANVALHHPPRLFLGPQEFDRYRDAWDLLEFPSWDAPWLLPSWMVRQRDQIQWPDDHPGIPQQLDNT